MTDAGPRIIDWLTAASGPAAADVARTLLLLRDTPLPRGMAPARRATVTMLRYVFARTYLAAYRRARPVDPHELTRWRLPILVARLDEGIAEERVLLTRLIAAELSN
jgi:aminoglycoside phosphotransferase (APT) family kinase protein